MANELAPTRPNSRRRYRAVAAFLATATLVVGACAYGVVASAPPLASLLPKETTGLACADAPWWWKTSEPIRKQQAVEQQMAKFQTESTIDIEKDILPWAGNVAVALTGNPNKAKPTVLVFIEVRDWPKFLELFTRLKTMAQNKPNAGSWGDKIYMGSHIQSYKDGAGKPVFQSTIVGPWLVLGTPGSMEPIVDTAAHNRPCLSDSPAWASVIKHLPQDAVLWGGLNVATAAASAPKTGMPAGAPTVKPGSALVDSIMGFAFTDLGNGIQLESVSAPVTAHSRNLWSNLAHGSVPLTDASLKQIPDGAAVSLVMNNPSRWWQRCQIIGTDGMSPKELHAFQKSIADAKPITDILADYTGDTSVSLVVPSPEKAGMVIASDAGTDVGAQNRVTRLAASLRKLGLSLYKSGPVWNIKTPPSGPGPGGPVIAPVFASSGSTVRFASNNGLLTSSAGSTPIVLPDVAKNADFLMVGNFKWLPMVTEQVGQMAQATSDKKAVAAKSILDGSKLEAAQWSMATKGALDGSMQQSSLVVQNWDWHAAFGNLVETIAADPTIFDQKPEEQKKDK